MREDDAWAEFEAVRPASRKVKELAWVADARQLFRRVASERRTEMAPKARAEAVVVVADPLAAVAGIDRKKLRQALMVEAARATGLCKCEECCSEKHAVEVWTGTETRRMTLHWPGEVPCEDCAGAAAWEGADCEVCAGLGYVRCQGW